MRKKNTAKTALTLLVLLATSIAAPAWERGKVERFATLPAGEAHPEGICVDRDGNVYVVTVAVNKAETSGGTLIVFDPRGHHLRTVKIAGSTPCVSASLRAGVTTCRSAVTRHQGVTPTL
jgi:hypothetical protein